MYSEIWNMRYLFLKLTIFRYNWLFLRSLVTLGFVGWIIYGLTAFLDFYILPKKIAPSNGIFVGFVSGYWSFTC